MNSRLIRQKHTTDHSDLIHPTQSMTFEAFTNNLFQSRNMNDDDSDVFISDVHEE